LKKLHKAGFVETHQRGSHLFLENGDKIVTVPIHGKDIPSKTIYSIIVHQAGMTVDEFLKL